MVFTIIIFHIVFQETIFSLNLTLEFLLSWIDYYIESLNLSCAFSHLIFSFNFPIIWKVRFMSWGLSVQNCAGTPNSYTTKGRGKRGNIVAETLLRTQMFPVCPCTQHLSRTKISELFQKHFASATMFPQQCFLVCHGLNSSHITFVRRFSELTFVLFEENFGIILKSLFFPCAWVMFRFHV